MKTATNFLFITALAVNTSMTLSCHRNEKPGQQIIQTFPVKHITVGGIDREYIIHIPDMYNGATPVPILFNFHGYTMTASNEMTYADFRSLADTAGFILVCPQGTLFKGNTHWNVGGWTNGSTSNDIGFVQAMIDEISANYNVDSERIYATGFSNGGFFSLLLACQLSNKIAAVASVGGSMTPETFLGCNAQHPTPVLFIHGTADGEVPYNGISWSEPLSTAISYWVSTNKCNPSVTVTTLPDLNSTDGSTVEYHVYEYGDNGVHVEQYKIINGNHNWPGTSDKKSHANQDINASVKIWQFLSQYDINGKM